MNTTENNKLIAEFMGCTEDFDLITHTSDKWWSDPKTHKYHTEWDWLMPVVQKIKNTPTYGSTDGVDFVLTCDLTKENLYESVVEFIKYYNEEKN